VRVLYFHLISVKYENILSVNVLKYFLKKDVIYKFFANQLYDLTKIFEATGAFTYNAVYATYNDVYSLL